MSTTPAIQLMNKTEARETVTQINLSVNKAAILIHELYNREGWKALGYTSWSDCASKEFEHSRTQVVRLLDEVNIRQKIADVPMGASLPERAIRELKSVPAEQIGPVLEVAMDTAKKKGREVPTAKEVHEAAAPVIQEAKAAAQPVSPVTDDKHLARIAKVCGKETRKAIENGTVTMSRKEVEAFAGQTDEIMEAIKELVMISRWPVAKAVRFISRMPDEKTNVLDLIHLCIAAGGLYEATVNGFDFKVTKKARK